MRWSEAFAGLFDDAAIFPPGNAPLPVAIRDHLIRRQTVLAPFVGPLIVPLDAIEQTRETATLADEDLAGHPLELSVLVPAGRVEDALQRAIGSRPELSVTTLEVRAGDDLGPLLGEIDAFPAELRGYAVFVELAAPQIGEQSLGQLRDRGVSLKFRTGGLEAHLFPTVQTLAQVIVAAVGAGVGFKLTAGLHRAVRYEDPTTGFRHHGFLNIAAATARSLSGAGIADVVDALDEVDGTRLIADVDASDGRWREIFRSFGTCSVLEPVESLVALGLLEDELMSGLMA